MKVAYIAGPYRAPGIGGINGIAENIWAARQAALRWAKKGYAVICPHLNSAFMDGALPDEAWLERGLELLRRSDVIVVLPGWQESEGSKAEVIKARDLEIEILFDDYVYELKQRSVPK